MTTESNVRRPFLPILVTVLTLVTLAWAGTDAVYAQKNGEPLKGESQKGGTKGTAGLQAPDNTPVPSMNSLKLVFPPGNEFGYVYKDSTVVRRMYSDSSTLDYLRETTYFLQMKASKDPADGVLEVMVNIDSLTYRFKSGDAELNYDVRSKMELKFPDLIAATVPVNREFTMKFSPYWEVVSTEGEMLDWLRNYIQEYGEGRIDSMRKFLWLNGITTTALAQFADFQKGALPNSRVHKDSTWRKPFFMKADGIDCRDDSATSRIAGYRNGTYTIETELRNLKVLPTRQRLYKIESMVDILGGKGKGTHVMSLTRQGVVTDAVTRCTTQIQAKIRREVFTETVESTYTWKCLGQTAY
ncbi:MAG: hypothetical protein ACKOB6_01420 [Candidatus Kapaibacterium sp.]